MAKNEKTGKRVAKIAGKILDDLKLCSAKTVYCGDDFAICTVAELKALAASALTQAPDKKK